MIKRDYNPDYLNSFLDYSLVVVNKSPNTIKEYNYDLTMFLRFIKQHLGLVADKTEFNNIPILDVKIDIIKKVTTEDILSFLYYIANKLNSKPATRARKLSSIKSFFDYLNTKAGKQYLIDNNPAYNIQAPKLEKRIPKHLSLDDSKKLLNVTINEENRNNIRDYAIITLFLNCGIRLSELVGINMGNIDFNDNKLTVIGKGNKERTIYLNKACIKSIRDYISIRGNQGIKSDSRDALFLSERKERISNRTVQYIVERELRKAGLNTKKFSVHKLRHTAATLMYQYGNVDIRALQELLGHESISTTEIYTHVANEQVRSAVEDNPLANI